MEPEQNDEKKPAPGGRVEPMVVPDLQKLDRLKKIIKASIGNCQILEGGGITFKGGFPEGWDAAMEKILKHLEA